MLVFWLVFAGCGSADHYGPSNILFSTDRDGRPDLYSVSIDPSSQKDDGPVRLIASLDRDGLTWSPDGSRIAFVSEGETGSEIHVARPDGTGRTEVVTSTSERTSTLTWSPDGSRLAYTSYLSYDSNDGYTISSDVYTIRPDGSDQTKIAEGASDPAWSPDGSRLAYISESDLYTVRSDGTGRTKVTGRASDPAWSPDGSRLAYILESDLYTSRPDGTGRTKVTGGASDPAWSPDGSLIAFTVEDETIRTVRPDGTGRTDVTSCEEPCRFTWSPDGSRIAYRDRYREEAGPMDGFEVTWKEDIHVVQLDGSGSERITNEEGWAPNWSPDGSRIAFLSDRDGHAEVYTMRPDGTGLERVWNGWARTGPVLSRYSPLLTPYTPYGPTLAFSSNRHGNEEIYTAGGLDQVHQSDLTRITEHPASDTAPTWAPGRPRLAFVSSRDGNANIYTVAPGGDGLEQVTDHEASDTDPTWGLGGWFASSRIAFVSDRDGTPNLYTIRPDGSGLKQLTDHRAIDTDPVWGPDGDRIAFSSKRDDLFSIYTISPDGTGLTQVTDYEAPDTNPAWGPSGDKIAFVTDQYQHSDIKEVFWISADGTGERRRVTNSGASDPDPSWGLTGLNRFLWNVRESAVQ